MPQPRFVLFSSLASLLPLVPLAAQEPGQPVPVQVGDTQGDGLSREQMWRAPTAEDWQKPVLIQWQRTWEDAVALSKETGKPILICVNMDGEIASEHYAGIRYRQQLAASLYEPYVPVIASVYRHTPRDYDEEGRRIPCPRFGTVTCGEHIHIEPFLFENYMEGSRVAPRHIMVELDGEESFDIFYAFDTKSVFQQISDGISEREIVPQQLVRGDRTITERVASRDSKDRSAVETAYLEGDADMRRQLLESALQNPDAAPVGLLRLAVFGFDPELSKLARKALAQVEDPSAVDLIAEALRVPMDEAERETLVAALDRLGAQSAKARTLTVVNRGLAGASNAVDLEGWSQAINEGAAAYTSALEWSAIEDRLAAAERKKADTPEARLELAEASLALAIDPTNGRILASDPKTASTYSQLQFEDARRAALKAEELGATGWRVHATLAVASYYLGDIETAYDRAERAAEGIPTGTQQWSAIATLALFAQARQVAIGKAVAAKEDWPSEWLTDLNAAYGLLAQHPLGTDTHIASHYDFLEFLGAIGQATRALENGLARFPESWVLHDRLRGRMLRDRGVAGLEQRYEEMLQAEDRAKNLDWYAGYASIVAAEFMRRRGRAQEAVGAYERAVAHFEANIERNPEGKDSADHYVAVALAGNARLAMEAGQLDRAVDLLVGSFERKPDAAGSLDGLNLSPSDTSRSLLARCQAAERQDLVSRLRAARGEIDPSLLQLPAYERGGPPPQTRDGDNAGRARGGRGRRRR